MQLIMMLTPLLTALANRFLLKQPTPVGLWPTMAVAVGGSAMMISGEWLGDRGAGADAGGPSGRDMAIGLALAVASMLLLTAYLVMLQVSWRVGAGALNNSGPCRLPGALPPRAPPPLHRRH